MTNVEDIQTLDNALAIAEDVVQQYDKAQAKIAALEQQLAEKDKVILEKVASAAKPVFDPDAMDQALTRLEQLSIIDGATHRKIAARLRQDPNEVFPLIQRLSEVLTAAPAEGIGVKNANHSAENDDPDGWKAFAEGREVKVKSY